MRCSSCSSSLFFLSWALATSSCISRIRALISWRARSATLGAQLVPAGAVGAEAGGRQLRPGLGGGLHQLVELQDLLLDAVQVAQALAAVRLPLPLELRLPEALLLRLPKTQVEDLDIQGEGEGNNLLLTPDALFGSGGQNEENPGT
ncbi:hypothetical protein EYF80_037381 [Liparis tanakae]|uniref:Secreted protein n=1 Tax=Liparis tanakae TaxID=230148 RepID=A0A4Z2GGR8_9TELE|nr:hypothetical protein EYF80_037381 [Liparis tanakae]